MLRVRVVRSFIHAGKRRMPGEELDLSDTYARALDVDGTVTIIELPARRGYSHRMMTTGGDNYAVRR